MCYCCSLSDLGVYVHESDSSLQRAGQAGLPFFSNIIVVAVSSCLLRSEIAICHACVWLLIFAQEPRSLTYTSIMTYSSLAHYTHLGSQHWQQW